MASFFKAPFTFHRNASQSAVCLSVTQQQSFGRFFCINSLVNLGITEMSLNGYNVIIKNVKCAFCHFLFRSVIYWYDSGLHLLTRPSLTRLVSDWLYKTQLHKFTNSICQRVLKAASQLKWVTNVFLTTEGRKKG